MDISEPFRLFCSDKIWLEGDAVEQFRRIMRFPNLLAGAAFPDLHPGRGVPVGAAFLFEKRIVPALIGGDIGCGMTLWALDLPPRKLKIDRLIRSLTDEPEAKLRQTAGELLRNRESSVPDPRHLLGTIGHGNHFVELLAVDDIRDAVRWKALNLPDNGLLLLVHAGSRGYGETLWTEFAAVHGDGGVEAASPAGRAYLEAHDRLRLWASFNRRLLAAVFLALLGCGGREILDNTHNSITECGPVASPQGRGRSASRRTGPDCRFAGRAQLPGHAEGGAGDPSVFTGAWRRPQMDAPARPGPAQGQI